MKLENKKGSFNKKVKICRNIVGKISVKKRNKFLVQNDMCPSNVISCGSCVRESICHRSKY